MSRASAPLRGPGRGERRIRRLFTVLVCLAFIAIAACGRPAPQESQPTTPTPSEPAVSRPVVVAPPDPTSLPCPEVVRIEVRKHDRVLEAWCRGGGLRVFPIGLSRERVGAKRRSGDQRIPEGDYLLMGPPRRSRFHLFIPIDYPSPQDADRGLAEGVISRAEHHRILAAHAAGRLPPQDTGLGGLVGFHGEGERWRGDLDLDWTEGCVAVSDEAISWLALHAGRGTPVAIRP